MATTIDDLSTADRGDFQNRLTTFGLDPTAVIQSDLVVPANTHMTLSASDPKSFVQPRILTTSDLDQLKAWIGIPDSLYQTGKLDRSKITLPRAAAPAMVTMAAAEAMPVPAAMLATTAPVAARMPAVNAEDIRSAAAAYIFGDSTLVSSYKTSIEQYFTNFQIIFWVFYTITVNSGSVLTIGPGQNVLSAWKIIVDKGGLVYAPNGKLKVDATILQVN